MSESRFAAEIRIDVSDLAEGEADEIQAAIESAIAGWKPTVTVDVREY
jgi:predicted Zn-dependent protease